MAVVGRSTSGHFGSLGGVTYEQSANDPDAAGGVSGIGGLRIPAATAFAMHAGGMTAEEVLTSLPDLTAADLTEVLRPTRD